MSAVPATATPAVEAAASVWPQLCQLIETVCHLRGDDAANRQALLAECAAQPVEMQADLLAHFEDQARLYRAALNEPEELRFRGGVISRATFRALVDKARLRLSIEPPRKRRRALRTASTTAANAAPRGTA